MNYVLYFVIALALSVVLHNLALSVFPKLGLLDYPERYNLKRKPIPYPTGSITIVVFCLFLFTHLSSIQNIGILIAVTILGIFSFIDDRKQLSSTLRFWLHILIGCIVFATGTRIYSITSPIVFDGTISLDTLSVIQGLPLLSGLFTVVWLTLTINALNWFDGIPGQVHSVSILGFTVIGLLALSDRVTHIDPVSQHHLAQIAFFLAGLCAAGLLFDLPVPRVIIGDTGAMFFGLLLGILTIYSGGKVATAFLVLGVPLLDSMLVIIRRILRKKKPWEGSTKDEHLHHRLLRCGWKPVQIILMLTSIGATFGISALYMSTIEKFIAALLLLTVMLMFTMYTEVRLTMKR